MTEDCCRGLTQGPANRSSDQALRRNASRLSLSHRFRREASRDRSEITAKRSELVERMAERVGVLARDFRNPNVYSVFAINSLNRNELASSNLCRRLRPFAGFCRFAGAMDLEMELVGIR